MLKNEKATINNEQALGEYGLTVASVTALSSQELSVELFNIMESIRQGNKSAWEIARAYSRIVNEELFDEDFDTLKDFATYVGVSPATITQYCKAVELIDSQPDMHEDMFTVGSAYLLASLGEKLGEFIAWVESFGKHVEGMSVGVMKDFIQKFKHKDDVPAQDTEDTEDTEDTTQDVEVEEIDKEGLILMIVLQMKENNITIEELQAHMA